MISYLNDNPRFFTFEYLKGASVGLLLLMLRGMFKNNVDFCYKKLSSQHRLIQTTPFRFGIHMLPKNAFFVLILFILLVHGLFISPW